ncbi:uncharacterized protein LOC132733895 [Ruditapes philippinarum]|uniref:uncharacterized protein LOC132733895 n=1 Tax=Ruditapes philippinarum TaxID=129788 RepID=UPI00295B61B3|nr:uncharacterized protein LOC132733895 [Ruditapes philippinarum]
MNGQVLPSASPFRRSKTLSTKLSQDSKLNAGWPSRPISIGNAWRLPLPPSAIKCDKTPPSSMKDMHSTARNMNSAGLPKHRAPNKDVPLSPPSTEVTSNDLPQPSSNDLPQPSSNASTTDTTDKAVPSTLQQSKINKAGCRYLVLPPLPRTMESCLQPTCNTDTEAQHGHLKPPKNINDFGLPSVRRDIHKDRSSPRETAELCLPSSREQFESKQNHQIPQKSPLQMSNQGESNQIKEQIMQLLLQKPAEVKDILYDIIEKRCGIDLIADDLAKLMSKTSIDCPDNDRNICDEVPGRRSLKEAPGASIGYTSHHNT